MDKHEQARHPQCGRSLAGPSSLAALAGLGLALAGDPAIAAAVSDETAADSLRRAELRPVVAREAAARQVPAELAEALIGAVSGWRTGAVGPSGEVGLMQVSPPIAVTLGFRGGLTELFKPDENLRYGMARLGQAWQESGGDLCRTLAAYRGATVPDPSGECAQVRARLADMGSPLAALPMAEAAPLQPPGPETTGSVRPAPAASVPFPISSRSAAPGPSGSAQAPGASRPFEMRPSDLDGAPGPGLPPPPMRGG